MQIFAVSFWNVSKKWLLCACILVVQNGGNSPLVSTCFVLIDITVAAKYNTHYSHLPSVSQRKPSFFKAAILMVISSSGSVVLKVLTPQYPQVKFSSICIPLFNKV